MSTEDKATTRTTVAIGDVHGQYKTLRTLLSKIPTESRVIFLGDLFDKGNDSKEVYHLLLDIEHERVLGNHDNMLIEAVRSGEKYSLVKWLLSGGRFAIRSFGGVPSDEIVQFLESAPLFITDDDNVFVHAGVRPRIPLEQQKKRDLIGIRSAFYCSNEIGIGKRVVFGHTPFFDVLIEKDRVGCDTGAGIGNALSCAIFDGDSAPRVVSVPVEY